LVEQGIENPRVGGSIPSSATIPLKPAEMRAFLFFHVDDVAGVVHLPHACACAMGCAQVLVS
jgi:hypothetical protein